MKTHLIFTSVALAAVTLFADDYQYVWNKTTKGEQTVTEWESLPSNGTHYAAYPFVLQYNGNHFFQLCTTASIAAEACGNEHAVAEISGCNARVSYINQVFRMEIDSGSYNWLDPYGEVWNTVPYVEWLRNAGIASVAKKQLLSVHGGTTRWPSIQMKGWCSDEAAFAFDGGNHYIGGTVTMPYDVSTGLLPTMRFDVSNGAKVGIASFSMGSGTSAYVTDRDLYFTVQGGAEVTISNSFNQVAPSGSVGSGVHRQHVLVKDSTVRVGPSGWMNLGASSATAASNLQNDILFTNAVFVGEKGFKLNTGTATFVDCAVTNLENVQIGGFAGADARLELKNCDTYLTNTKDYDKILVGYGSGASGTLYVEGGKFYCNELDVGQNWSATVYIAATGTLELAANTSITIGNNSLYLGKRYGALGRCTLGPTRTVTVTGGITLGRSGVGELTIAGGACSASAIDMGSSSVADLAKAPGTNVLKVTSGTLALTGDKSANGLHAGTSTSSSARACRVELAGGVLTTPKAAGTTELQWSELIGDGGTLRANWSRTDWLQSFDEAKLGARGLTLDSAGYNVTVSQSFTDLPGAAGRLILAGSGTKTLAGSDSYESVLVAAGGSTVFADGAAHHSSLVVTNGASVSLSASAAAALTGLTLGDADSYGELALVKDRVITVAGDLTVRHAHFTLGDGFTLGTVATVFSVTGAVTDETIERLNEAVIVSGLPTGTAATFARSGSSPKLVTLTVTEASDIVITSTVAGKTDSANYTYAASCSVIGRVSSDADLTLSGKLTKGGLKKEGAGTMYLTNHANRFLGSVILYEGRLSVSSIFALGYDATGTGLFHLKGGTLELADPSNPASFPYTLVTDPDETINAPVVVKTDEPTVFSSALFTAGAFFKRGKSPLVFCADGDVSWNGGKGNYDSTGYYWIYMRPPSTGWPFDDAKGTLPGTTCYYGAFNVVEGDVVFTSPEDSFVTYQFMKDIRVGSPTQARSTGAPNPRLVIDHAAMTVATTANRQNITVGGQMTSANSAFESVELLLTNNAVLNANLLIGNTRGNQSSGAGTMPVTFTFDHSTVNLIYGLCPVASTINIRNSGVYTRNVDSSGNSTIGAIGVRGNATINIDGGILAANAAGDPLPFYSCYETQTVNCSNGGRFCCNFMGFWNGNPASVVNNFNFDDGEWYPGDANITFSDAVTGYNPQITVTGKGLVLAPPADRTYTFAKKIGGTGGFVKRGAGALVMPVTNLLATGAIRLEAGRLTMTDGPVTNEFIMTAGTLADTTVTADVLLTPEFVGGTLVAPLCFENATLPEYVKVDVGEAEFVKGDVFVFGTYTGTAPDVAKWRLTHRDENGRGLSFSALDGVITARVQYRAGLVIRVK